MSKSGLVDAPGRITAPGARNPGRSGGDRRDGAGPRGVTRHGLDEVQAGVEPIAFVAAEEERAVLRRSGRRPSRRTGSASAAIWPFGDHAAVGVAQRVEVVRRVELVAARSTRTALP